MHIHSVFSANGRQTLEQIAENAKNSGINVIIPADHDIQEFEYGIWPFSRLIKKTIINNSILYMGGSKYLNEIHRVQEKYPDMVIIPGVESAPYYYWTGNPLKKSLTMNNWHKHILLIGLNDPRSYDNLPVLGNQKSKTFNPILLWPAVFIIAGFFLIRNRTLLILFQLAALLLLLYNYPYNSYMFNQYNGDQKELPYQNIINYTANAGGLTFWAHPEARNWKNSENFNGVSIKTKPYPESILDTFGYTGFSYFWEGTDIIGKPEGFWDTALTQYCKGTRKSPVWATAELDYIEDGLRNNWLNLNKNILYVEKLDKENVMDSLRKGRFFITSKQKPDSPDPVMNDFAVSSDKGSAIFGETLNYSGSVKISFNLNTTARMKTNTTIRLIENGRIVQEFNKKIPLKFEYIFTPSTDRSYCRFEIDFDCGVKLVSNPVFLYNN